MSCAQHYIHMYVCSTVPVLRITVHVCMCVSCHTAVQVCMNVCVCMILCHMSYEFICHYPVHTYPVLYMYVMCTHTLTHHTCTLPGYMTYESIYYTYVRIVTMIHTGIYQVLYMNLHVHTGTGIGNQNSILFLDRKNIIVQLYNNNNGYPTRLPVARTSRLRPRSFIINK